MPKRAKPVIPTTQPACTLRFTSEYLHPLHTRAEDEDNTIRYRVLWVVDGSWTRSVIMRGENQELARVEWGIIGADKICLSMRGAVAAVPLKEFYENATFTDPRNGTRYRWENVGGSLRIDFALCELGAGDQIHTMVALCKGPPVAQTMKFWTTDETLQDLAMITSTIYFTNKDYNKGGSSIFDKLFSGLMANISSPGA